MPRKPKPYFRKQTKSWYFSTGGQQYNLGKDHDEAMDKFHEIMKGLGTPQQRKKTASQVEFVEDLKDLYLDHVEETKKAGTYNLCRHYLRSLVDSVGESMTVVAVEPKHLYKWAKNQDWNDTSKNDAYSIVQRMFNWALEEEHVSENPVARLKKPKRKRREIVYTPEQWKQIKKHAKGHLVPFLDFLWMTGCRPLEARSLEARHVHDDLVIFPPDESKGEIDSRVIFMTPEAKSIIEPLVKEHPTGVLFRNSRGVAWTKDAVKCRLKRISEKVNFRVIAYGARHSFATNALIRSVDAVSLAHLLGHRDTRMVTTTYSHLAKNVEFLRQQAVKATDG